MWSGEPKPKEPTTQSTLWVQQEREQQLLQGTSHRKSHSIALFLPADAEHAGRQGDGGFEQHQHEQQQEQHVRRGGGAWFFLHSSPCLVFTLFQVIVTEEEVGDFLVQCYAQKEKEKNLAIGEE